MVAARSSLAVREAGTCGAWSEAPMPLFRPAMALIGSLVRFARPQTPPCAWPYSKTPGRDWATLPETLVLALSTVPNRRLVPSESYLLDVRLFGGPHPGI